jgi:undecaprenyl-diphosphatase
MFEFNELIVWLERNPQWIAVGIIGASFVESFALIGIIIPGVVLLAVISGLAATSLSIFEVVMLAYFSSLLSDIASFFIGFSLRNSLSKLWPFRNHPEFLINGQKFFKRYGMIGLFVGKFIGPIRPLLPITAGSLNMNKKSFFLIEILSCFLWALIYTIPGYYAGQSVVTENSNPLDSIWFWIGIIVLLLFIRYFSKKFK